MSGISCVLAPQPVPRGSEKTVLWRVQQARVHACACLTPGGNLRQQSLGERLEMLRVGKQRAAASLASLLKGPENP